MDISIEKPKTTPKDFFIHLGIIITLYISAISLLNLLFDTINAAFPDRLDYYVDPYSTTLRWALASLIIIFPLFLVLSLLANRDIRANPAKAEVGVRKWLTYLTLFLGGIAIVTDLVVLINTFLGGEITTRFVLKVLAVLVVTGVIFWYYLYDLKKGGQGGSYKKTGAIAAAVLVLVSIVGGFAVIGSPMTAREKRFDATRASDLYSLQSQVTSYWQQKAALPKTLEDLKAFSYVSSLNDPETGAPYEYKITGGRSFELCAVFDRDNKAEIAASTARNAYYYGERTFAHGKGRDCLTWTIDPDIYPPARPSPAKPVPGI